MKFRKIVEIIEEEIYLELLNRMVNSNNSKDALVIAEMIKKSRQSLSNRLDERGGWGKGKVGGFAKTAPGARKADGSIGRRKTRRGGKIATRYSAGSLPDYDPANPKRGGKQARDPKARAAAMSPEEVAARQAIGDNMLSTLRTDTKRGKMLTYFIRAMAIEKFNLIDYTTNSDGKVTGVSLKRPPAPAEEFSCVWAYATIMAREGLSAQNWHTFFKKRDTSGNLIKKSSRKRRGRKDDEKLKGGPLDPSMQQKQQDRSPDTDSDDDK